MIYFLAILILPTSPWFKSSFSWSNFWFCMKSARLGIYGSTRKPYFTRGTTTHNLWVTPWKIYGRNPKMAVWKMIFLFKGVIFRFQPLVFRGVLSLDLHVKDSKGKSSVPKIFSQMLGNKTSPKRHTKDHRWYKSLKLRCTLEHVPS